MFNPKIHEIELKKDLISNLLAKALAIFKQETPPPLSTECKNCSKMDGILDILSK